MSPPAAARGPEVFTFGCRLNAFESQAIREMARRAALDDVIIVNTCAVTTVAEREARQAVRRLQRERPGAFIVVTGCAAQLHPEAFAAMPGVSAVLGNAEKLDPMRWQRLAEVDGRARLQVGNIMGVRTTPSSPVTAFDGHSRAFLAIQQGCDHRCTFCIIPYSRGPSRSVPAEQVIDHARALVARGYREVVLTGVDLTAWGGDLAGRPRLGGLVRRLLRHIPELPRLRLSSLDPAEFDDELWQALAEERRLMPHLHLSLQAGDNLILKRMKRRHSRSDALALAARARGHRPEVAFGADLIAGFPTEDEAMFARTRSLISELDIAHLHVFPFSPRPGTPAARMPPLPRAVVRARAQALREAGSRQRALFYRGQLGRRVEVLVERSGRAGIAADFARITLDQDAAPGCIVAAEVIAARDDCAHAHVVA